jgi:16S rRNA (adenine1518-N6/adenine1519-N6)-dimethyltransferase
MNKAQLLEALELMNMRPGKILGQNFLIDANLLEFIVRNAQPEPDEVILEAGPGFGVLTRPMLESGADVYCIEFDRRLCEYLRNNVKVPNFHLIEGDACRVDIEKIIPENKKFKAIANLPYSISSIFISKLLDLENPPVKMLFMLQKEMGMRLAADHKTKNYGSLSVRTQHLYDVSILRMVPREVFHPRPDVGSALVSFTLKPELPDVETRKRLNGITKLVFGQRRKKMIKPLASAYGKEAAEKALLELGFSENTRPGELTVEDFDRLARIL